MPVCLLEKERRLSRSLLWKLQRRFFATRGIEAWRQGIVPYYITSNPFIARAYACIVRAFVRDCQAGELLRDPRQPIYIVELGAGSGCFAYHFLRALLASDACFPRNAVRLKYIMTDFAARTLKYWKGQPALHPFVESGHLAFGRFDAGRSRVIKVSGSQEILAPGRLVNPLIVLANYFFDGIPQDLFCIRSNRLYEQPISLFTADGDMDGGDPDLLERIQIAFGDRPIDEGYYDDPVVDAVLSDYKHSLADAAVLFPCAAMRCIRDLGHLSDGRMLLVSADQGYSSKEELLRQEQPKIHLHGSCSLMVNYHALGQYVLKRGGQVFHTGRRHRNLNVSCFILGYPSGSTSGTHRAFEEAIGRFGPDDFFTLKKAMERLYGTLDLSQILAFLRLSGWDATVFRGALPALLMLADAFTLQERQEVITAVRKVWEAYYPIGEEWDLPFQIGVLLYRAACFGEALEFFRHSARLHGPDASTSYDMGLCYYMLGQQEYAQAYIDEARRLDPSCEEAPWRHHQEDAV